MASKIKQKILDEIFEVASDLDESSTKALLLKSLYNQVNNQNSDTDIVNTVWANKELPLKMFTSDEINMMPSVKELLIGEPRTGKVDLEKSFGTDWKEHFNEIPITQIDLVAEKNGVSRDNLLSKMRDEVVKQERYDVAHGGVPGKIMSIFSPRQQEAIERGEDPSTKDIAGDLIETGLYAVPYGRIAGAGASLARKALIQGIASNVAPPLLNETSDAAMYDSTNARGNFSPTDVLVGTGTNMAIPALIRRGGTYLNRASLPTKALAEFAEGESTREAAKRAYQTVKPGATGPSATSAERAARNTYESMSPIARAAVESKKTPIFEIAAQPGANLEEKTRIWITKNGKDPDKYMVSVTDGIVEKNAKAKNIGTSTTDDLVKAYDELGLGVTETTKSGKRLAAEEALKNFGTNKIGDTYAERNKPLGRVPLVGNMIQSYIDEASKEEERRKLEEEIERQYQIDLLFGRQR
jgi:hypothetical protein